MKSRSITLLIGGMVGALIGLLVAWIIFEDESEGTEVGPGGASRVKVRPNDAINLVMGAIALVRQIAALRQR